MRQSKFLKGLKTYYEEHHNIKYSPEAIISAVELSNKYIGDRKLPDKAIDVIDEAGASQYLLPEEKEENYSFKRYRSSCCFNGKNSNKIC